MQNNQSNTEIHFSSVFVAGAIKKAQTMVKEGKEFESLDVNHYGPLKISFSEFPTNLHIIQGPEDDNLLKGKTIYIGGMA